LVAGVWTPTTVDLSVLTTKGDIPVYSSTGPGVARLAVGQDGAPLVADSAQAAGVKYGGANYKYFEHEGVSAYNSSDQSIPHATWTDATWDSERYDDGGYHDTSSNQSRLTAVYTGRYRVSVKLDLSIPGTLVAIGYKLKKNGSDLVLGYDSFTMTMELNAGDYVEAAVYQENGSTASASLLGGSTRSYAEMMYLGTI